MIQDVLQELGEVEQMLQLVQQHMVLAGAQVLVVMIVKQLRFVV